MKIMCIDVAELVELIIRATPELSSLLNREDMQMISSKLQN
jgi:hypothetical protein